MFVAQPVRLDHGSENWHSYSWNKGIQCILIHKASFLLVYGSHDSKTSAINKNEGRALRYAKIREFCSIFSRVDEMKSASLVYTDYIPQSVFRSKTASTQRE